MRASGGARRLCPVCAARVGQLVDQECRFCLGAGLIDLGAAAVRIHEPVAVAEAVAIALSQAASEDTMTMLAVTGIIDRPDLVERWNDQVRVIQATNSLLRGAEATMAVRAAALPTGDDESSPTHPSATHDDRRPRKESTAHQELLDRPLLTTQEVAEVLGVKVGTVENWRYKEEGPAAVKIGRAIRYRGEIVRDWINNLDAA